MESTLGNAKIFEDDNIIVPDVWHTSSTIISELSGYKIPDISFLKYYGVDFVESGYNKIPDIFFLKYYGVDFVEKPQTQRRKHRYLRPILVSD